MQTLTLSHPRNAPAPDLVAVLAARDAAALGRVYDEHRVALCAFCRRLLGDAAAAEDLMHDVFVRLPELIHKLEAGRSLRAFLFAIASHRAKHYLRAASRRRRLAERFADEPRGTATQPDHAAEQRLIANRIALALESLPRDQQVAFMLAELEGRDAASIASLLRIPEATARTRLFHARRKLRVILSAWGILAVFIASAALAATQPAVRHAVATCAQRIFGANAPPRFVAPRHPVLPRRAHPSNAVVTPALSPPSLPVAEPAPVSIDALPELATVPATHVVGPTRAETPTASPSPASSDTAVDPELAAYRAAHRIHFDANDPAASLKAWDQYLENFPASSFAADARFNRAVCLIRLGRDAEARAALEPFASTPPGSYRQTEAASLLRGLDPAGLGASK